MNQKLSEYHTGYRAFSGEVLRSLDLSQNSDDFIFDNQMIAQIFYKGFEIGEVTSGTFSPTLKNGIALALLDSSVSLGTVVVIDVRGRQSQAEVVNLPFVQSHVK